MNKNEVMSRKFLSFAPQNYKTISIYKLKNKKLCQKLQQK